MNNHSKALLLGLNEMDNKYTSLLSTGDYRLIETEDGSYTLYSKHFDEACHSLIGAVLETNFQYIEGCKIVEVSKSLRNFSILEVGFGLGRGLLQSFEALKAHSEDIQFLSLEIDPALVQNFVEENHLEYKKDEDSFSFEMSPTFKVCVVIGNARKKEKFIEKNTLYPLMAIYQDAFSPKKNRELWTLEWFQFLAKLSNPTTILSTYSSSLGIRKTLLAAGWGIYEGGSLGAKRSSTRATKSTQTELSLARRLENPKIEILRDNLTTNLNPL